MASSPRSLRCQPHYQLHQPLRGWLLGPLKGTRDKEGISGFCTDPTVKGRQPGPCPSAQGPSVQSKPANCSIPAGELGLGQSQRQEVRPHRAGSPNPCTSQKSWGAGHAQQVGGRCGVCRLGGLGHRVPTVLELSVQVSFLVFPALWVWFPCGSSLRFFTIFVRLTVHNFWAKRNWRMQWNTLG